jgi:hypothetical protein
MAVSGVEPGGGSRCISGTVRAGGVGGGGEEESPNFLITAPIAFCAPTVLYVMDARDIIL